MSHESKYFHVHISGTHAQLLSDGLVLLFKEKDAAFKVAKETGHAYPENPVGFRPADFGITDIINMLTDFYGDDLAEVLESKNIDLSEYLK